MPELNEGKLVQLAVSIHHFHHFEKIGTSRLSFEFLSFINNFCTTVIFYIIRWKFIHKCDSLAALSS